MSIIISLLFNLFNSYNFKNIILAIDLIFLPSDSHICQAWGLRRYVGNRSIIYSQSNDIYVIQGVSVYMIFIVHSITLLQSFILSIYWTINKISYTVKSWIISCFKLTLCHLEYIKLTHKRKLYIDLIKTDLNRKYKYLTL